MSLMTAFTRSVLLRIAAASMVLGSLAACGGGGEVSVGVGVVVPVQPPVIAPLTLVLTRVGPEAVQVDWSDDPAVASFVVLRDGLTLATVTTTTSVIDASAFINGTFCYEVQGYDASGLLVAASSIGCITILP